MSVDMGQADRTLRTSVKAPSYDWTQVIQTVELNRGDKCVVRQSNSTPEILKIEPQWAYKEWVGCFSFIGSK